MAKRRKKEVEVETEVEKPARKPRKKKAEASVPVKGKPALGRTIWPGE